MEDREKAGQTESKETPAGSSSCKSTHRHPVVRFYLSPSQKKRELRKKKIRKNVDLMGLE